MYSTSFHALSDDIVIAREGVTLVVIAGQSNALKHALSSFLTDQSLVAPYPNVQIVAREVAAFDAVTATWTDHTIRSLAPETFNGGVRAGMELSLGRDLDRIHANRYGLLQFAVSGSSQFEWAPAGAWPSANAPAVGGNPNLFSQWITAIQSARAAIGATRTVVVWEQGGADADTQAHAQSYAAFLTTLYNALVAALGPIGFVYGRANADTAVTWLTDLRASQTTFSSTPGVIMVNLDSITLASGLFDSVHYSSDGYVALGHLYSVAVATALGKRVLPQALYSHVDVGLQVTFTDASTAYGSTIVSRLWDFGDGATSTATNPVHTYAGTGTYNVTETVINAAGDSDTSPVLALSVISGITGVTRDAASGYYFPATATEDALFATAIGSSMSTVDAIWNLQETSGNAADAVGSVPLVPAGTMLYQQAVAGFTRLAVGSTDGLTMRLVGTAAGFPDISTTSVLVLVAVQFPVGFPAASRNILQVGTGANRAAVALATATSTSAFANGNIATGTHGPLGAVHWVAIQVDRANSLESAYTELDKMIMTYSAGVSGRTLSIGASPTNGSAATARYLWMCAWYGTKAQVTAAQIKNRIQGHGATVLWT